MNGKPVTIKDLLDLRKKITLGQHQISELENRLDHVRSAVFEKLDAKYQNSIFAIPKKTLLSTAFDYFADIYIDNFPHRSFTDEKEQQRLLGALPDIIDAEVISWEIITGTLGKKVSKYPRPQVLTACLQVNTPCLLKHQRVFLDISELDKLKPKDSLIPKSFELPRTPEPRSGQVSVDSITRDLAVNDRFEPVPTEIHQQQVSDNREGVDFGSYSARYINNVTNSVAIGQQARNYTTTATRTTPRGTALRPQHWTSNQGIAIAPEVNSGEPLELTPENAERELERMRIALQNHPFISEETNENDNEFN